MNILPKQYSQFKEKSYWDNFFKELQKKQNSFDWYGTLQAYRQPLFITLNTLYNLNNKQKRIAVAHLGCGNSTLSQDILKAYPVFDFHIDNFDYSEAVISEMQQKTSTKNLQQKLKYKVCNLLKDLEPDLIGRYSLIIDKGTLDAILPEDKQENIKEIKQVYFENAAKMINPSRHGRYVIVSMLQQFVLRTILEKFHRHPHFTVQIAQCAIPDSELQPFLIDLAYSPEPHDVRPVKLTLLTKATVILDTPEAVIKKIAELQKLAVYTSGIKNLRPGQITKFNLHSPTTHSLRYMLDIIDSSDQSALLKNNCSVFIVPPGMQAQFSGQSTLKQLHSQVSTSRLIVVKLMVGQKVKNVQEVKDELNSVLVNIIQKGCKINEVPYLTDGAFEERQYLYRDQEMFIEEIMQNGQSFRRLILKNSPSLVQSQFKLTYFSQKNHSQLKLVPSLALPHKKGLVPGIDHHYLDQGYCRTIVAGLQRILEKGVNFSLGLHLGGGAATIPKFIYHKYPDAKSIIVESSKNVIINCEKFFEWPREDPRFIVLNRDALIFVQQQVKENQYDFIIVDISNNEEIQENYPPKQFTDEKFIKKCLNSLNQGGILVYNTISLQNKEPNTQFVQLFDSFKEVGYVYKSTSSLENVVFFVIKINLTEEEREGSRVVLAKNMMKSSSRPLQFDWQEDYLKQIQLLRPLNGDLFKKTGLKVVVEEDNKKKKKKKK